MLWNMYCVNTSCKPVHVCIYSFPKSNGMGWLSSEISKRLQRALEDGISFMAVDAAPRLKLQTSNVHDFYIYSKQHSTASLVLPHMKTEHKKRLSCNFHSAQCWLSASAFAIVSFDTFPPQQIMTHSFPARPPFCALMKDATAIPAAPVGQAKCFF